MFDYLSPKNGPVFDGLEHREIVYAKDQPEYIPLRTLVSVYWIKVVLLDEAVTSAKAESLDEMLKEH